MDFSSLTANVYCWEEYDLELLYPIVLSDFFILLSPWLIFKDMLLYSCHR